MPSTRPRCCGVGSALAQKVQVVAPPPPVVPSAVARCVVTLYRCHGGGPADGALNGAVIAVPLSSTRHGQPSSAKCLAILATVAGSVTFAAVPSTTRSNSWTPTLIEQRGSRATLRPLRLCSLVTNHHVP